MQVVWPVSDSMACQGPGRCSSPLSACARSALLQRTWTPALISLGLRGPDRSGPAPAEMVSGRGATQDLALSHLGRVGLSSPGS